MKLHYFYFFILSLCFVSCHEESDLEELLNIKANINYNLNKTIVDVKDNYQINIGDDWKRELYFDQQQSRIYAADTTKSFLSSFIVDFTQFDGKIELNENFRTQLIKQIEKQPRSYVINEGFIEINKVPAYCVFSFSREPDFEVYYLSCYLKDHNSYYFLTSTLYGSDHMKDNLKEAVSVFNSFKLLNKQ